MKTPGTIIAMLVTLAASYGQNIPQIPPPQPIARTSSSIPSSADAATLDTNYTIEVKGGLGDSKPIDVTLSGNGPRFTASLADPFLKIEILANKKGDKLTIDYAISGMIPIQTGNTIQYEQASVTGNYYASLGEAFPILKVGDKILSIQIDKTKVNK